MKFAAFVALSFAALALASPRIPDEPPIKTPQSCKLTGDNVRHRNCPCTGKAKKCNANGEYSKGRALKVKCLAAGTRIDGYVSPSTKTLNAANACLSPGTTSGTS